MRVVSVILSVFLLVVCGSFHKKRTHTGDTGYRKHIQFNHLFVVIDDSTYKYLFDSLQFLKTFAATSQQDVDAGSASWSGKYVFGADNYLEIFKPGGIKRSRAGDFGLGFITNQYGTIDSLRGYWAKTLDSIHTEHTTTSDDGGKTWPWFTSVSIPNADSLSVSAWVFENSREEMHTAGYTDSDLAKPIAFRDYNRRVTAAMRHVPVDSVKFSKLFDKVTSVDVRLSRKELLYLRHTLLDIGFTENRNRFVKDDFSITYSVSELHRFSLQEIDFSLLRKVPKETHSFRHINLVVDGDKAVMTFRYP